MALKKFIVNPNTTLLHDGMEYKGGTVAELDEDAALRMAPGTLLPATSKEIRAKVEGANAARLASAQSRLDAVKAEAASLVTQNQARQDAFDKEKELADMRLADATAAVAAAEAEAKKAQGEMDGASAKPAPKGAGK